MALIVRGSFRRDERLARQASIFNAYAYHKPSEIPEETTQPDARSRKADDAYVRAWMKNMAKGHVNGS